MDKCLLLSDVSVARELVELEDLILPENATDVANLRDLPKLRRISYTYDQVRAQPASAAAEFWKELHDLRWLRSLRADGVPFTAEQLPDGTWKVALGDAGFSDLTLFTGAHIS